MRNQRPSTKPGNTVVVSGLIESIPRANPTYERYTYFFPEVTIATQDSLQVTWASPALIEFQWRIAAA